MLKLVKLFEIWPVFLKATSTEGVYLVMKGILKSCLVFFFLLSVRMSDQEI